MSSEAQVADRQATVTTPARSDTGSACCDYLVADGLRPAVLHPGQQGRGRQRGAHPGERLGERTRRDAAALRSGIDPARLDPQPERRRPTTAASGSAVVIRVWPLDRTSRATEPLRSGSSSLRTSSSSSTGGLAAVTRESVSLRQQQRQQRRAAADPASRTGAGRARRPRSTSRRDAAQAS